MEEGVGEDVGVASAEPILLTSMDDDLNVTRATVPSTDVRQHEDCMNRANSTIRYNTIRAMIDGMRSLGADVSFLSGKIRCEPCMEGMFGAYDYERKEIILCENNIPTDKHNTLYTEVLKQFFIKAYDDARVHFNKDNLLHLACNCVRITNLINLPECGFNYCSR